MNKIIFIAPDEKTAQLAIDTANNLGINIVVYRAKGDERFKVAQKASKEGAEVAVSRWGFSLEKAKKTLDISIVNVEITGFDIVRTLHKVRNKFKDNINLAIVHNQHVVKGFLKLAPCMNIDIKYSKVIHSIDRKEINDIIKELSEQQVNVIIGGLDVKDAAQKRGIKGVRIEAGSEGIEQALLEAYRLIRVKFKEREKANRLKTILNFSHEGIIALDSKNNVDVFNKKAGEILGVCPEHVIGKNINRLSDKFKSFSIYNGNERVLEKLQRIGDKYIISNHVPVFVDNKKTGMIITFVDTERVVNLETKVRKEFSKKGLVAKYNFSDIIGKSQIMKDTLAIAKKFSSVDASILIQGETGTGKEMFAQSIHNNSSRREGPFVAVNCAALPESILESELFGYAPGAFTGAKKEGKAGLFELAHNGTIFLDEVGEMPLQIQAKFLRVLQERRVIRVGGDTFIPINIRVISATNHILSKLVEKGKFRQDLYFRLATLVLNLPPLRERKEDILVLFKYFYEEYQAKLGKKVKPLRKNVIKWLLEYDWPGNIRELKNAAERLVVLSDDLGYISEDQLKLLTSDMNKESQRDAVAEIMPLEKIEEREIKKALEKFNGNRKLAAEALGISKTTLWRKLKKMGFDKILQNYEQK